MQLVFGFSKHKGFAPLSNLIQFVLSTPYSHVFVIFQLDCVKEPLVFHSTSNGINLIPLSVFEANNEIVSEDSCVISEPLYNKITTYFFMNLGTKPYAYLQNIGIFLVDIINLFGYDFKYNPFTNGVNCSELIANVLEEVYGKWTDKDYNLITPKDIYAFLENE